MGFSAPQANLFSLLPPARTPWLEFAFSIAAQIAAVACLILIRLLAPHAVASAQHAFRSVGLVSTPILVDRQPQPVHYLRELVHSAPAITASPTLLRLPVRQPAATQTDVAAPSVVLASRIDPLPIHAAAVIPREAIRTNVFSTGSSAVPTITRTASQVQTGGFGDPHGVPARPNQNYAVNIASSGSFDLPPGIGHGNGTSLNGAPGVVASAGFGNGTALPLHTHSSATAVSDAGFSNAALTASPEKKA